MQKAQIVHDLPLKFAYRHGLNINPGSGIEVLPNPSNNNEILIFEDYNLSKSYAFNTQNHSHTQHILSMWPTILFREYKKLHPQASSIHFSKRVGYFIANSVKSGMISLVGCYSEGYNGHHFSFYALLDTIDSKLHKIGKSHYFKFFPSQTTTPILSTLLSYKNFIIIIGVTPHETKPDTVSILNVEEPKKNAKIVFRSSWKSIHNES